MKRFLEQFLLMGLVLFASQVLGWSQTRTGEIRVKVTDQSGAPMQVSGRLQSLVTGTMRGFETDSQGGAVLDGLSFGRYRLEVTKDGFSTATAVIDVGSETSIERAITMTV